MDSPPVLAGDCLTQNLRARGLQLLAGAIDHLCMAGVAPPAPPFHWERRLDMAAVLAGARAEVGVELLNYTKRIVERAEFGHRPEIATVALGVVVIPRHELVTLGAHKHDRLWLARLGIVPLGDDDNNE